MPTTVAEAFAAVNLVREGVVRWGSKPTASGPGVYIISLTESLNTCKGELAEAPLSEVEFRRWLAKCQELTLDGSRPTVLQLTDRIRRFWIPDEVILYIGCTKEPLPKRLRAYYKTEIGAPSPHSGGYFLKLLSNLDQLWVHYAQCDEPELAEDGMLRRFCEHVSQDSKAVLQDPIHPFPFANLEWCARKVHGLLGARRARKKTSKAVSTA